MESYVPVMYQVLLSRLRDLLYFQRNVMGRTIIFLKGSCALTDIDKDVSNADWWSNDTHLVYTCHAGYSVQGGNLLRNCTPNGEWSGQPPSCTGSFKSPIKNNLKIFQYQRVLWVFSYFMKNVDIYWTLLNMVLYQKFK